MKFEVGDRVEAIVDHIADNETLLKGDAGTIVRVWEGGGNTVSVCWDFPIKSGHDCGGYCERGYGWNVHTGDLKKSSQEMLVSGDIEVEESELILLLGGV